MAGENKNPLSVIANGIIADNPTFVQCIGLCPTIAVTSSLANGIGMGLAATFVLIASNAVISLIRKIVPDDIRIPIFIVVIAAFVTVIQFVMEGYAPTLNRALGIFIPLIVVNCIILARAEAFASKNGVLASICDGLGMGLGFTCALAILGAAREILGSGTLLGTAVTPSSYDPALLIILAPGGFLMLGMFMALFRAIRFHIRANPAYAAEREHADGACPHCAMSAFCRSKTDATEGK